MRQAILILLTTFLLAACDKKENKSVMMSEPETIIADKEVHIEGSPLRLPAGTRITKSPDGYELEVELPEGYSFLTPDFQPVANEVAKSWPIIRATYKCKCSGDNACQVFYQGNAGGFGCLHQSCSGSCTGSFTILQQEITGVLNKSNPELSARKDVVYEQASLTSKGREDFFSNAAIQSMIAEQYEVMYSNLPKPDFQRLATDKRLQDDYVYLKVSLYGIPFYMVAPKEMENYKNSVNTIPLSTASCRCDSGKSSCTKKGWKFLDMWETYWCDGDCNACELTIRPDKPKTASN